MKLTRQEMSAAIKAHADAVLATLPDTPQKWAKEPTALTYWFPLIRDAGLPVPDTMIVETTQQEFEDLWAMLDGKSVNLDTLLDRIWDAGVFVGGPPFFLRTDYTSDKHSWRDSCFVRDRGRLLLHVSNIANFSGCIDAGIETWIVRRMIPTTPAFFAFCGMPIVREFRFFVRDGAIEHIQPYWPPESIEEHTEDSDWREKLNGMNALAGCEMEPLSALALEASAAVPGFWSVDFLQDSDGKWWLTDMAEGNKSYRWNPST